jgi:hypothetical protein
VLLSAYRTGCCHLGLKYLRILLFASSFDFTVFSWTLLPTVNKSCSVAVLYYLTCCSLDICDYLTVANCCLRVSISAGCPLFIRFFRPRLMSLACLLSPSTSYNAQSHHPYPCGNSHNSAAVRAAGRSS